MPHPGDCTNSSKNLYDIMNPNRLGVSRLTTSWTRLRGPHGHYEGLAPSPHERIPGLRQHGWAVKDPALPHASWLA